MKKLAKNVLGVFVLEDGEVIDHREFSGKAVEIAKKISCDTSEEKELEEKHGQMERIQIDAFEAGKKTGLVDDRKKVYDLMKKGATERTRSKLKEDQEHDQVLIQAVRRLTELEKQFNRSFERLKAWYSLYFPELDQETDKNQEFLEEVYGTFKRKELMEQKNIEETTGFKMDDRDLDQLKTFVKTVELLDDEKESLTGYIESLAEELMPNTSSVAGPLLAAKTVSEAGSLKKLARMPSSTVQVLGAEKALFRHMEGKGSAPKHGIIFLHHTVSGLPEGKRGKMARYLANKLTLAARLDMYNGNFKGKTYREQVEKKFRELKRD